MRHIPHSDVKLCIMTKKGLQTLYELHHREMAVETLSTLQLQINIKHVCTLQVTSPAKWRTL